MSIATWDTTMAVNLRAPFLLTKALLPRLKIQKSGTLINILSSAGSLPPEVGQAFMSAYSASKGGLAAFTLSLAPEVELDGIRVTGIWIGITDTQGARNAFKTLASYLEMPFEQFREAMISPDLVAAVIAYVATKIDEYHGTTVESDKLMEKLGLTEKAPLAAEFSVLLAKPPPKSKVDLTVLYRHAVENTQNLVKVIQEIKEGINLLPFFVRPMANRALKSKTGAGVGEWESIMDDMMKHQKVWEDALKTGDHVKLDEVNKSFIDNFESIIISLNKLQTYISETPREAARFTKDQQAIKMIKETALRQASAVKASISTMEIIYNRLEL